MKVHGHDYAQSAENGKIKPKVTHHFGAESYSAGALVGRAPLARPGKPAVMHRRRSDGH
jgi:hypothetical protein